MTKNVLWVVGNYVDVSVSMKLKRDFDNNDRRMQDVHTLMGHFKLLYLVLQDLTNKFSNSIS